MGLDQWLKAEVEGEEFVIQQWRKHADLQGMMEKLAMERDPTMTIADFNCSHFYLTEADCKFVMRAVIDRDLPYTTGFFYGKSINDETELIETYTAFAAALGIISNGGKAWYTCWW